jgi:uncharacterized protein (DUF983 family)
MASEINPFAVRLARAVLILWGIILVAIGAGFYFSGMDVPTWVWVAVIGAGVLSLLLACLDSASGVVATVMIFFYPIN